MSNLIARPMQIEDQEGLIALFELVFGETVTPAMWAWKYMPPWAVLPHCWVGLIDGQVIGYFGAVPARGYVDGAEVPFFQFADFMVHPDHRRKHDYFAVGLDAVLTGLGSLYDRYLIYGFSDHRAFLGFRRSKTADLIEKAVTLYVRPDEVIADVGIELQDLDFRDPIIDTLWQQRSADYRLGLVRDVRYLSWRYGGHPVYRYKAFLVQRDAEPIGWLVIGNDGAGKNGRPKEVPVVDLWLADAMVRPALGHLVKKLRAPVMAWLPRRSQSGWPETKETGTHVYHFCKNASHDTDLVRANLYYTMGDVDWW